MTYMLCRNRVEDFAKWRAVFASHPDAHEAAGIKLTHLWREADDPNNVFFMFEVASVDGALEFVNAPESAKAGEEAGVIDGEIHFIEEVELP